MQTQTQNPKHDEQRVEWIEYSISYADYTLEITDKEEYIEVRYNEFITKVNIGIDEIEWIINKRLIDRNLGDFVRANNEKRLLIDSGKLAYKRDGIIIDEVALKREIMIYLLLRMYKVAANRAYEILRRTLYYHGVVMVLLMEKCPRSEYYILKVGDEELVSDQCAEKLKAIYNVIMAIYKAETV